VAQSYFAAYARTGGPVKSEEDPFDPSPAREMRETVAAIRHLEEAVLGARWTEGIVLRYGGFYGPATSLAPGAQQVDLVRRRKFPVVGDGTCPPQGTPYICATATCASPRRLIIAGSFEIPKSPWAR
jgi:hypothetical protein